MNDQELRQHLEFECHAHNAALKSDAEWHGLPFEPVTFEEFARRRNAVLDDSLPRLKPCPFCGAEPRVMSEGILDTVYRYVQCRCGVRGPMFSEHRHLAVQGWNKMCRREPCN